MKFEKLSIDCGSIENRGVVLNILDSMGYIKCGSNAECLFIHTYPDGEYQTYFGNFDHDDSEELTFEEFVTKYGKSEMKQSIEKAMAELKMGREELSSALGMSRPYITKMLTRPQSEKTQNKVVGMIDELMQSGGAKNIPIPDIAEKLLLRAIIEERDKTIKDLNQALEYKDQLLAKYQDDLQKQTNQSSDYINDNLKLSEKIQELRSHNHSITSRKNSERMQFEKLTTELSNQVEILKRKNKDINICYSIVCVILTALVVWGFYV